MITDPQEPKAQDEESSVLGTAVDVVDVGGSIAVEAVAEGLVDSAGEAVTGLIGGIFDGI